MISLDATNVSALTGVLDGRRGWMGAVGRRVWARNPNSIPVKQREGECREQE